VDDEEEWAVEEILDSRMVNRRLCYLIKWEGFGVEHNSWEPWDNVHALELVADFTGGTLVLLVTSVWSTSAPFLGI